MKTCPECSHPLPHGPRGCFVNMNGKLGYAKVECQCVYGVPGTHKIADLPPDAPVSWTHEEKRCYHPDHDPPKMRVWEPGIYQHVCPSCGERTTFRVERRGR